MADIGTARRTPWSGWITFAGVLLAVLGVLNVLEGLVALLTRQVSFIDGDSLVVVNLTGLGVVMLVFGALLVLAGVGLLLRNTVARVAAIVIVALHALSQIAWLGAYPVWSLLMITLDVIVLFALTVHWGPREAPAPAAGVHRAEYQAEQQARTSSEFPLNQPGAAPSPAAERYGPGARPGAEQTPGERHAAESGAGRGEEGTRPAAAHRADGPASAPTSGPGGRPQ